MRGGTPPTSYMFLQRYFTEFRGQCEDNFCDTQFSFVKVSSLCHNTLVNKTIVNRVLRQL